VFGIELFKSQRFAYFSKGDSKVLRLAQQER